MDHLADRLPGKTISVLECPMSTVTFRKAVRNIITWGQTPQDTQPRVVLLRDAHGVLQGRHDRQIQHLERTADLVLPDGMPLVWLLRQAGVSSAHRIYGPDLLHAVCHVTSRKKIRHGFLGGSPGLENALTRTFPDLDAEVLTPTIADGRLVDRQLIHRINALNIHLLWVGLGCPKQDLWIASHRPYLNVGVALGVGAAFDFLEGRIRQAPRLLRRYGLEWAWRLCMEPQRLAPRYAKIIPHFTMLACRDLFAKHWE